MITYAGPRGRYHVRGLARVHYLMLISTSWRFEYVPIHECKARISLHPIRLSLDSEDPTNGFPIQRTLRRRYNFVPLGNLNHLIIGIPHIQFNRNGPTEMLTW